VETFDLLADSGRCAAILRDACRHLFGDMADTVLVGQADAVRAGPLAETSREKSRCHAAVGGCSIISLMRTGGSERPHVMRGRDLTAPGSLKRAKPTMSRRGFLSSRLGAGPLPRSPNLWLIEMLAHFLVKVVTIYRLGQEL
jgi:hypothetical protein